MRWLYHILDRTTLVGLGGPAFAPASKVRPCASPPTSAYRSG